MVILQGLYLLSASVIFHCIILCKQTHNSRITNVNVERIKGKVQYEPSCYCCYNHAALGLTSKVVL